MATEAVKAHLRAFPVPMPQGWLFTAPEGGPVAYNESVKTVSERLGHTNAAMTLNIYTHLWPDSEERTRAAVDKAYADSPDEGEAQDPEAA